MERMRVRTDLALEAKESFEGSDVEVHGVVVEENYDEEKDIRLTRVQIVSERGAREACGKLSDAGGAGDGVAG